MDGDQMGDLSWLKSDDHDYLMRLSDQFEAQALAIMKMIDRKESELGMVHGLGEIQYRLERVFSALDARIEKLELELLGGDEDGDLIIISEQGLSERLLALFQKADEAQAEIGAIRDDLLASEL